MPVANKHTQKLNYLKRLGLESDKRNSYLILRDITHDTPPYTRCSPATDVHQWALIMIISRKMWTGLIQVRVKTGGGVL